jgi:predicted nucleotidyltransferase
MPSLVRKLTDKGLITPPKFLPDNIQYETLMGSVAYGVSSHNSDNDVYGIVIPPKETIFPHLGGAIFGFDVFNKFEQYQQHHIRFSDKKEYDIQIYNIVKFFKLGLDGTPNIIDSLFTPRNCVLSSTQVGEIIRENRKLFLSKKIFHTLRGYSYSQLNKALNRSFSESKRKGEVEKYGYSVKSAYHVVRLLNQCEQALTEGDIDLQRNREQLKSIRHGDWTKEQLVDYFNFKEKELEKIYNDCDVLPYKARTEDIKQLLLNCLEHHYGNLSECVYQPDKSTIYLKRVKSIIEEAGV